MTIPKNARNILAALLVVVIAYAVLYYPSTRTSPASFVEIEELTVSIETDRDEYYLGDTLEIDVYAHNDQSSPVKLLPLTTEDFNVIYLNDPNALSQIGHADYFSSEARENGSTPIPARERILLDTKSFYIYRTGIIRINFLETTEYVAILPNFYDIKTTPVFGLEGLISQEDDPYHDWNSDPSGPKVKSLDVLDPEDGMAIKTYILTDPDGQLFRFFPVEERVAGPIWEYNDPVPVSIVGFVKPHHGINNQTFQALNVYEIKSSEIGEWVTGVFSRKDQHTGSFTFYNRTFGGDYTFLTIKTGEEELVLASREGYVYNVPFCGTGQPIAECRFNETITVRGLRSTVTDSLGQDIPTFMVFELG